MKCSTGLSDVILRLSTLRQPELARRPLDRRKAGGRPVRFEVTPFAAERRDRRIVQLVDALGLAASERDDLAPLSVLTAVPIDRLAEDPHELLPALGAPAQLDDEVRVAH